MNYIISLQATHQRSEKGANTRAILSHQLNPAEDQLD